LQDVHLDQALTQISLAYRNEDFVADQIAPRVAVRRQTDRYFIYNSKREWMRPSRDLRAPGAAALEMDFSLSTESYFCEDHALAAFVPDEERDNADPAILPDLDRVEYLTERLLLNREVHLGQLLTDHPQMEELDLSGEGRWDDPSSFPLSQISRGMGHVVEQVQRRPNTLLLSGAAFEALRTHPAVLDRLRLIQGSAVSTRNLEELLDVERVLVGRAGYNSAPEGEPPAIKPIFGNHAWLLHVPTRPGLRTLSAAYTFVWHGPRGASSDGLVVERWREPRRKADGLRVQMYYDHKLTALGAIYRFRGTVED
jgi:hypothetical protein